VYFVTGSADGFLAESRFFLLERDLNHTQNYKGYALFDDTAMTEEGSYRARAIVVRRVDGRVRSQRFIDLETFAQEGAARERAMAAAQEWIDDEESNDKLALPTNFSSFEP
jgi:hypothetical protein